MALLFGTKYTMLELIYTLCEINGKPFYVGRTERTLEIRFKEHQYSSKNGTEMKYQYIRKLPEQKFEIILLAEVGEDTENFEDFWVYTLIMEGYDLTNMKAGDAKSAAARDAMREMKNRGQRFSTPKEFLSARDKEIEEAKARKANQKLLVKTRKQNIISDHSTTLWAGDYGKMPLSKGLQKIMEKRNGKK